MINKMFKLGFIVGRFQLFHKGHEELVKIGKSLCEKFVVIVGSTNESRTIKNPFTFEERKEMIQTVCGEDTIVLPIVDIGIGYVPEWGNYLINTIKANVGEEPDFAIRGAEFGREKWLPKEKNISEFILDRSKIKISATQCRRDLINGNTENLSNKYSILQFNEYCKILKVIEKKNPYKFNND